MKIAIVVLADTETHGDLGRAVNALEAVKELKEAGDDYNSSSMGPARSGPWCWPIRGTRYTAFIKPWPIR